MLTSLTSWAGCKNILCIRPDNMGDLLMSVPALRALKQTFGCRITLLTSAMAGLIVPYLPGIDEVIIYNLPWIKADTTITANEIQQLISQLKEKTFDAAIVFTVCSQNPIPAIMLAYLAEIPKRLAYCRENPYTLLTHWVPDAEPYTFIRHQVARDLALVASIGAKASDDHISFILPDYSWPVAATKLTQAGVDLDKPWLILHAPVSEQKRGFDKDKWIAAAALLRDDSGFQIILTGAAHELELVNTLKQGIGESAFAMAGILKLDEFMAAVQHTAIVLSVNTATIHIAAAAGTPVVVLYACTNPQHTPWKVPNEVLYFPVEAGLESKNEVVRYLQQTFNNEALPEITPQAIADAARRLLQQELYKAQRQEDTKEYQ